MRDLPFDLTDQDEVGATVTALNDIGPSSVSSVGNGAEIPQRTTPGAPMGLTENYD